MPKAVNLFIIKSLLPNNRNFEGLHYKNYFLYTFEVNKIIGRYEENEFLKQIFNYIAAEHDFLKIDKVEEFILASLPNMNIFKIRLSILKSKNFLESQLKDRKRE